MGKSSLFCFTKQASYEVVTFGACDSSSLKELLGLDVEVLKKDKESYTLKIRGVMRDQAALSGLLNTLYELRLTVLSVNLVEDEEKNIA